MNQFLDKASVHFKIELDYCEKFKALVESLKIEKDLTPKLIRLQFR